MMQLTLDQYAAWLEQEKKWRLTKAEQKLLKESYSYTRSDRNKEMPEKMKYVRNTKARQYRRVRTFEAYLNELERQRERKPHRRHGLTARPMNTDSELSKTVKIRLAVIFSRCGEHGIEFDLDFPYLLTMFEQMSNCPCCGDKMTLDNAQVDRHVPSLGYVKTNVNLLCSTCNRLKSNHTVESLQRLLDYVMR